MSGWREQNSPVDDAVRDREDRFFLFLSMRISFCVFFFTVFKWDKRVREFVSSFFSSSSSSNIVVIISSFVVAAVTSYYSSRLSSRFRSTGKKGEAGGKRSSSHESSGDHDEDHEEIAGPYQHRYQPSDHRHLIS